MGKKMGLGRGLDSLISKNPVVEETPVTEQNDVSRETMMNINLIEPNRFQPRKKFDEDALTELAESIKLHGIIQPIVVQKKGDLYEIIAGERRWRASRIAKLKEVPVIIKDYADDEVFEIALIENLQREDLNAIEEAMAYQRLVEEYSLKQDEVAERVSKSRVTVTNSMRLLKLDPRVQQMVVDELLTGGHARALLAITDPQLQYDTASRVFDDKLSVRETEKLVKSLTKPSNKKEKQPLEDEAIYRSYEDKIRELVGAKVEIQRKDVNKGKIVIDYNSLDEFERIYSVLRGARE